MKLQRCCYDFHAAQRSGRAGRYPIDVVHIQSISSSMTNIGPVRAYHTPSHPLQSDRCAVVAHKAPNAATARTISAGARTYAAVLSERKANHSCCDHPVAAASWHPQIPPGSTPSSSPPADYMRSSCEVGPSSQPTESLRRRLSHFTQIARLSQRDSHRRSIHHC